jgi:hypothetical protein
MEFYRVASPPSIREDNMGLHENRTEVERLLAATWEYEHRRTWKATLAKWLFPLTLSGAVVTAYDLPDVKTAVTSVLAPAETKPTFDTVAAANVEEDIDYRIAQRTKSLPGWQAFLEAHRDGPHAEAAHAEIERLRPTPSRQPDAHGSGVETQAARTEVEKTLPTEKAFLAGAAAEASGGASTHAEGASDVIDRTAAGREVAALTPDEVCKRDGDRLERLRSSPNSDDAARFVNELGCEKLRPQLLALMDTLDHAPSAPAVALPRPSVEVGSARSQERRPPVRSDRTRWTVLHSPQLRQHANTRRMVDRRTQYVVTMWLDCPVEETGDRPPRQGCLLLARP